jgi:hypothetical protein
MHAALIAAAKLERTMLDLSDLKLSRYHMPRRLRCLGKRVSAFEYTMHRASSVASWAQDKVVYCCSSLEPGAFSRYIVQGEETKCRAGDILHWKEADNVMLFGVATIGLSHRASSTSIRAGGLATGEEHLHCASTAPNRCWRAVCQAGI